ncbi:hypothetical protein B7P43_G17672 [Cryptotermes secundus]|uniref:Uncharacterized protein n=1 Tax=Cryptotermes secundus TaxID=105785 RepID=A0A2J7PTC3_9NEOP|nr:hypothetical protein B7P43_G17672 [Cryptotermes secundus]
MGPMGPGMKNNCWQRPTAIYQGAENIVTYKSIAGQHSQQYNNRVMQPVSRQWLGKHISA